MEWQRKPSAGQEYRQRKMGTAGLALGLRAVKA